MIRLQALPPAAIVTRSPDAPRRPGKAHGPVIILPHDAPAHLLAHESAHVRDWYGVTALTAAALACVALWVPVVPWAVLFLSGWGWSGLFALSPGFRFSVEARAYAVSVRVAPERHEASATALFKDYNTGRTLAECRNAIKARV